MASTTLDESGTDLVRTVRATLDFKLHIRPITEESVRENYKGKRDEEIPWGDAERENRLLLALLNDEEALRSYLTYIFINDLQAHFDHVSRVKIEYEDEEILEPFYSRMNEEDAEYFKEAKERGLFFDSLWHIQNAFSVKWDETELIEIERIESDKVLPLED